MISKEQWKGIQNTLSYLHYMVKFRLVSGEEITVNKSFVAENKTALIVWIDGKPSPVWGWPEHEDYRAVTELVWRKRTFKPGASAIRRISKTKQGQKLLKRKEFAYLHEVKEFRVCDFSTAASLVRQFRKIEGLELVTPEAELKDE